MGAYCAAKSVVIRLTKNLADELKDSGINVNCVLPSIIDTARNRQDMPKADHSKWLNPAHLARASAFLIGFGARDPRRRVAGGSAELTPNSVCVGSAGVSHVARNTRPRIIRTRGVERPIATPTNDNAEARGTPEHRPGRTFAWPRPPCEAGFEPLTDPPRNARAFALLPTAAGFE
jgi:hypothetical protein